MRILIAPNYFKGSLSAIQVADIISDALKSVHPDITTIKAPLADGGDGTIEAVHLAQSGELINTRIHDPLERPIESNWLKLPDLTAIIPLLQQLMEWESLLMLL